jgi:hypothetical protein
VTQDYGTTTAQDQPTSTGYAGDTVLEQQIPNVDPFTYNWESETQKSYDALSDFYKQLLDFAGGRLDLAKRMLEYTYQQGMREAKETYETTAGELERIFPEETARYIAEYNRRGMLGAGFGKEAGRRLEEGQEARTLANERNLANKESRLRAQRGFELEESERGYKEEVVPLERQRRKESEQMARDKYTIESAKYDAQLQKQLQEEQRRTQNVANQYSSGVYQGTSGGSRPSGYGSGDAEFRRYMQTMGKQAELDAATRGSTMQGAEYEALKTKYGF